MSTPPASSPSSPLLRILLPLAAGIATGDFFYPHLALSTNLLFLFTLLVGLSTASLLFFRRTPPAVLTTVGITLTPFSTTSAVASTFPTSANPVPISLW